MDLYGLNPYNVPDKAGWMDSRKPLFKAFARSLQLQTVKDFVLVVAIDPATSAKDTEFIVHTLRRAGIEFVFQVGGKPKEYVQNMPNHNLFEWLITSRCDSDDLLEPEFMETIQKAFKNKEELLDVRGVQYDGKDYFEYHRKTPGSPFVTLIEPMGPNLQTASFKKHAEMKRYFFSRFVGTKPLFVQVIHGGNIINKTNGNKINYETK
jgi:hypothetical protein